MEKTVFIRILLLPDAFHFPHCINSEAVLTKEARAHWPKRAPCKRPNEGILTIGK